MAACVPGSATSSTGAQFDRDADLREIKSNEASDKTRRRLRAGGLEPRLDRSRRGVCTPMRRPHSLDPAALLIDQHGRVGATDAFPERARQRAQLIAVGDIALKQDQTPRVFPAKERAFLCIEHEARAAADECLRHLELRAVARKSPRVAWLTWR